MQGRRVRACVWNGERRSEGEKDGTTAKMACDNGWGFAKGERNRGESGKAVFCDENLALGLTLKIRACDANNGAGCTKDDGWLFRALEGAKGTQR